jgi:hypothetical protein
MLQVPMSGRYAFTLGSDEKIIQPDFQNAIIGCLQFLLGAIEKINIDYERYFVETFRELDRDLCSRGPRQAIRASFLHNRQLAMVRGQSGTRDSRQSERKMASMVASPERIAPKTTTHEVMNTDGPRFIKAEIKTATNGKATTK